MDGWMVVMHMYVYIYMYICLHACIHVFVHLFSRMCAWMHACMHACMHTDMFACVIHRYLGVSRILVYACRQALYERAAASQLMFERQEPACLRHLARFSVVLNLRMSSQMTSNCYPASWPKRVRPYPLAAQPSFPKGPVRVYGSRSPTPYQKLFSSANSLTALLLDPRCFEIPSTAKNFLITSICV